MNREEYEAMIKRENSRRRNHMRKVRRRRICALSIFALALACVLVLFGHVILSEATDNADPVYKYYTSITVAYGDTLWSLAEEYAGGQYKTASDYVDEVMFINHLHDEKISAGQYLVIPYYSSELK